MACVAGTAEDGGAAGQQAGEPERDHGDAHQPAQVHYRRVVSGLCSVHQLFATATAAARHMQANTPAATGLQTELYLLSGISKHHYTHLTSPGGGVPPHSEVDVRVRLLQLPARRGAPQGRAAGRDEGATGLLRVQPGALQPAYAARHARTPADTPVQTSFVNRVTLAVSRPAAHSSDERNRVQCITQLLVDS